MTEHQKLHDWLEVSGLHEQAAAMKRFIDKYNKAIEFITNVSMNPTSTPIEYINSIGITARNLLKELNHQEPADE